MSVSTPPVGILLSAPAKARLHSAIAQVMGKRPFTIVSPLPEDAAQQVDIAFVTRDITGTSTKHELQPDTVRFYERMRAAPALQWVHIHSAGADRQIYLDLAARGVQVNTSAGTNAAIVAQTALAAVLAQSRRLPLLMAAQHERRWAPLLQSGLPPDLAGQTAVVVGWGAIGQRIGALLCAFGVKVIAVRRSQQAAPPAELAVAYAALSSVLPRADWVILACPLSPDTTQLINAAALAQLPASAYLINVARGEVVDETALTNALQTGQLAGAFLDVFAHEPLSAHSPLWAMPNVIVTPHSAGFSAGNAQRVDQLFLDKLLAWLATMPQQPT
jgi:phosphoglycerate dehydrogenase-like enzyme